MKTFTKLLAFTLILASTLISCENNELDELKIEQETTAQSQKKDASDLITEADFTGKIKRIRIKKKRVGTGYRVIGKIENNDTNTEIATIDMKYELISEGNEVFIPEEIFTLERDGESQNNAFIKFTNKALPFEGDLTGLILQTTAVLKNHDGKAIGEPEVNLVTAEDFIEILNKPTLKQNRNGETFRISSRTSRRRIKKQMISTLQTYSDSNLDDISDDEVREYLATLTFSVKLNPENGGSDAEQDEFILKLEKETETAFIFRNRDVRFFEIDNVVDMEYTATVTVTQTNGEELDYAEFRITGQE